MVIFSLYLVLFFLFSVFIFKLNIKKDALSKSVLIAIVLGGLLGVSLQFIPDRGIAQQVIDWYGVVGNGYINLLKVVAMPLVFISILSAINKLENAAGIGRMSLTIVASMMVLVMLAGFIGLITTSALGLDAGAFSDMQSTLSAGDIDKAKAVSIPALLTSLIPSNIFSDLAGSRSVSVIGVVIFALLLGVALLHVKRDQPQAGEALSSGINALQLWVMRLVRMVIALTPYGVMALIAKVAFSYQLQQVMSLLGFIGACYLAIVLMFVAHGIILAIFGRNPLTYFKTVWPALSFAFVSRSSAASIPLAISSQEKFGVPHAIANISASFGSSMGQNGCAGIYPAIMVAMIAPTMGIDPMSPGFILTLLPVIAMGSMGVAGVGGGGTFAALIVLSTLNFPVEFVGIFIAIEPLVDMGRTALNVNGSMMAGVISTRLLGKSNIAE